MGRAAYAACRRLRAETAPVRSSDRGERDRAAGIALTIQIVAKHKPASIFSGEQSDRQLSAVPAGGQAVVSVFDDAGFRANQ
jgi:hypothetical protein